MPVPSGQACVLKELVKLKLNTYDYSYMFQTLNSMTLNTMTTLFLLQTTNGWPVKLFKSYNESVLRESIYKLLVKWLQQDVWIQCNGSVFFFDR